MEQSIQKAAGLSGGGSMGENAVTVLAE